MSQKVRIEPYAAPSGGWGSVRSLGHILAQEGIPISRPLVMTLQNKTYGFACVSCARPKPADPHTAEFCENGAKATGWEITTKRIGPEFFAKHTVTKMLSWTNYQLEAVGRLTHPMRWDPATDTYLPVSWESTFREIGQELRQLDGAREVVFYASGRALLETSYMWGLFARLMGSNNLPDSSNMCHESTSVALPESIGVAVGTVLLKDFKHTDCNIGSGFSGDLTAFEIEPSLELHAFQE